MKILHLAVDEKFIDMGVNSFERVWPGCNEVLVYSNSNKLKVKYCNAFKVSFIDLFNPKYINKIRNADVLVLHSLLPIFYPILLFSKKETPLVWIGWGRDYYDYLCKESELTLPVTKRKIKSLKGERNTINKIREFFFLLMKSSLLKRITHFAPVLKEEYRGELTKYKYLDWNYGTIEKDFVPNKNIKISGNKFY
ncbi:hypothetical protein C9I98_11260 [Photobacterium sanctipauli]|uniref:Glycosyltransferase subfamily 4-like N-terminal domain-containing protein n=1 Tax=Photobacterium sanctipauli TaxID=1342794 RepID=A0A2T3NT83_9GAMM|nr:hypothetical protein [Photobacterium sanctipauli]PSW19490.1 hypothetical protein C9I98_11260 [Photobacterium sanctipauli]